MANQPRNTGGDASRASEASGRHHGLYRPGNEQRVDQKLDKVGLDDQGDMLEDEQRDRRSRGAAPDRDEQEGAG
jgi:hypothetical protein